jgi:hypothetical protein
LAPDDRRWRLLEGGGDDGRLVDAGSTNNIPSHTVVLERLLPLAEPLLRLNVPTFRPLLVAPVANAPGAMGGLPFVVLALLLSKEAVSLDDTASETESTRGRCVDVVVVDEGVETWMDDFLAIFERLLTVAVGNVFPVTSNANDGGLVGSGGVAAYPYWTAGEEGIVFLAGSKNDDGSVGKVICRSCMGCAFFKQLVHASKTSLIEEGFATSSLRIDDMACSIVKAIFASSIPILCDRMQLKICQNQYFKRQKEFQVVSE